MIYTFEDFEFDTELYELRREGSPVPVEPQVFDVLLYLVEHCDRVVSKQELFENVWQTRFVTESALTSRIKAARRALGDDGRRQRLIATVHGRGYRFLSPVEKRRPERRSTRTGVVGQTPGATGPAPVRRLPWRPSALIGRDRELDLLLQSLATKRLVTVVGPGGVGKTRLALEIAHRLLDEGRMAWWVDLTVVSSKRVVDALADSTGVDLQPATDPTASLCAALGAHRGVLCLDNAEHLLDPLALLVERLIDAAPELVVLVTSRERLALDEETVRALSPLPSPQGADSANPAVRLFLERAAGLEPEELTVDDIGLIAEACRRLDGLPLAIELGAARAATFGLGELTHRLGERLDLLAGGRRTADRRHRTLRTVVDWSHELLTEDEARLFARLAVFPGAFSLDQAESVCVDGHVARAAMAPLLARLVDQSLVQAGRGRFWLLETLRAYASERLEAAGEEQALRERHARVTTGRLSALDRRLWTVHEAAVVDALTELVVDLHAAWEYALGHDRSLAVQLAADTYDFAYFRQRLDFLGWGSRVASWEVDDPRLPRALAAAAAAARAAGRRDEARQSATRGVAVAGGEQQPAAARALDQCGNLAMFKGQTGDAVARFRRAAELHRAAGEDVRSLLSEASIAQVLSFGGRSAEAQETIEDVLARCQAAGNPTALSWAYYVSGLAWADDDLDQALTAYSAAIQHGMESDSRLFVMLARSYSLALTASRSPPARALDEFQRILNQWERLGNELAQWWVLLQLVVLLARIPNDWDAAVIAWGGRRCPRSPATLPRRHAAVGRGACERARSPRRECRRRARFGGNTQARRGSRSCATGHRNGTAAIDVKYRLRNTMPSRRQPPCSVGPGT
jgi:predicted ATPase/DNA-binding winged helix-turn-helix (wHTH) protein